MIRAGENLHVLRGASAVFQMPRRADPPHAFALLARLRRGQLGRLRGSISPSAADSIASAIQTQEGYYPGSLAYRNNNPGNLVFAGQPGATPGAGGFAAFDSYADGRAALVNQIDLDATRGTDVNGNPTTTVAQLIASWAPPSQNDTATYVANVSASTGFDPNAPLESLGTTLDASGFTPPDVSTSSAGLDLSQLTSATVDLSAVGLPSSTPALYAAVGGIAALALLSRLF